MFSPQIKMSDEPETPQYVSVGPSDNTSVTLHKKTFSTALIAGIIFLGFLLVVIIIGTVMTSSSFGRIKSHRAERPPKQSSLTESYIKLGLPENLTVSVIDTIDSSDENTCAGVCNRNRQCSGFFFDNGQCTTFSDDLTLHDTKYHDRLSIYVKNKNKLHFDNKIFLARYGLPPKFWEKKQDKDYAQLDPLVVTKINFVPNYIKTNKQYTGVYSKYRFDVDQIKTISTRDSTYIHYPGEKLDVPWKDAETLFVVYLQ